MNTKTLIITLAALGSASLIGTVAAQGTGSGSGSGSGSGTGAGAAAPGSAASSSSPATASGATSTPISPRASRAQSGSTRAAPDMSPTMPSRSATDPAAPTGNPATDGLPPGITRKQTPEGISPISGLPKSQLPAVSRGSAPEIPTARTGALEPAGRVTLPSASTGDIVGTTGQPAPNPQSDAVTTMTVPVPPPVATTENTAPATTPGDPRVWVPGHYTWTGSQWTWVSGSFQRAPGDGSVWIPGHYDVTTKRWTPPHWGPSGSGGHAPKQQR